MLSSASPAGSESPTEQPVGQSPELVGRVHAFLAQRPDAGHVALLRFLRDQCGVDGTDARALARAILAQMARREDQILAADSFLVSALAVGGDANCAVADWPLALQRAAYHQVASLLYVCLERDGRLASIPDSVADALRAAFDQVASRTQALYAELGLLLDALAEGDIEAIVLKGIALALALYGQAGARSMVDLDIMVRPGDVPGAEAILRRIGYRQSPVAPSIRPPEFLRRYGGSAEYAREGESARF